VDILDPQKWIPLIQTAVENLLTPFELLLQRLVAFSIPIVEAAGQRLIDHALDRLETKTLPLLATEITSQVVPALNQMAEERETQLLDRVETMMQGYQIGLIKKP